jgi:phage shock protein A
MGILDRLSTILRANINAMLDQAEDPEKTLDQLIRDMASAIGEARGQVAEMIAQEKLLEADMERNSNLARDWGQKAELAVSRGADDLAKEALRRKIDYDNNAQAYQSQLQAQQQIVAKLKHDLGELENKYEGAVRNREALIARHRRAVAQQKVAQTAAQLTTMDPSSELSRMEQRIRMEEARAAAISEVQGRQSLEDQFAALEGDSELDRQLADLKARVSGALPPGGQPASLPSGSGSETPTPATPTGSGSASGGGSGGPPASDR